jgi:hypothetical protein
MDGSGWHSIGSLQESGFVGFLLDLDRGFSGWVVFRRIHWGWFFAGSGSMIFLGCGLAFNG